MIRERSLAFLQSVPEAYVYPVVLLGLLLGTAAALASGEALLGIGGLLALAIVSLTFGALQTPEEMG